MKNVSKTLILFALLFCCKAELFSQENKAPELAIIKLIEYHDGTMGDNSKLITIKPDDSVETKELDKAKIRGGGEGVTANLLKLKQELQKWLSNGYVIKSSFCSSPVSGAVSMTTIFLQKN